MLKKIFVLSFILPVAAAAAEMSWAFNKLPAKRADVPGETFRNAVAQPGIGKAGSGGLLCTTVNKNRYSAKLNYDSWQVSLDLKLDKLPQAVKRSIFAYEFQDWNRSRFLLEITRDGRLQGTFQTIAKGERRKRSLYFEVNSEKLEWIPGKWYHLRFGSEKGGEFRMERDGLLVGGKTNAPALADLDNKSMTRGYPLITFGCSPINPHKVGTPLMGVIDNIRISDRFFKTSAPQQTTPAVQAKTEKRLFIGSTPVWSGKFDVLDQTTDVLGAKRMADKRFVENAARAGISIQGNEMVVDFLCPVPKDMKLVCRAEDNLWKECVEFFICPVPGSESGYHYAIGANGKMYTAKMIADGKKDDSFVSKATAKAAVQKHSYTVQLRIPLKEIGLDKWRDGDEVRGNFAREGKSCGGLSTWAPVGDIFYNPGRFGTFVLGSRKAYISRKLESLLKSAGKEAVSGTLASRCKALRNEIAKDGNKAEKTNILLQKINILRQEFIVQQQKQRKLLIWSPEVWRNDIEISLTSVPIKKISLSGTLNSHILYGFAVSNLSDKPFMGQLKLMSGPIDHNSNERKWFYIDRGYNKLLDQASFFEGIGVETASGMKLYDALSPLPLNTLLRIPPRTTVPVWLRISTKGLKPGSTKGLLTLKPVYDGFEIMTVPFKIDLLPVDMGKVFMRNYMYSYLNHHPEKNDTLTHFLVDHGVNMIYINGFFQYVRGVDKNGRLKPCDFSDLDSRVERFLRCGVPVDKLGLLFFLAWDQNGFPVPASAPEEVKDACRTEYLQQLVKHLTGKFKIKPENLVFYPVDEPLGSFSDPKSRNYKAAHFGKLIKKAVPQCRTMVNPRKKKEAEFNASLKYLSEIFDIIQLYRPRNGRKDIDVVRKAGKHVWYYHIMQKETAPEAYRRYLWENVRDGVDDVSSFWHLDAMAGGDGLDPYDSRKGGNRTDYGAVYADFNFGQVLTSRRYESYLQGLYDFKTVKLCRELLKKHPDPVLQKKVEAIIARAIKGDYSDMDKARQELLQIILKLQR